MTSHRSARLCIALLLLHISTSVCMTRVIRSAVGDRNFDPAKPRFRRDSASSEPTPEPQVSPEPTSEPGAPKAEPGASEQARSELEPTTLEPEPAASEPATSEPEPTTSEPEPETSEPEPTTPEPEPDSKPESEYDAKNTSRPYSEPEGIPEPELSSDGVDIRMIFLAILYSCIVLIILTNVCVTFTICYTRTPSNIFILSLSISDACVAIFVIPGYITALTDSDRFADWMCKTCHYTAHASIAASAYTMVTIAWDRFMGVVFPTRPKLNRKKTLAIVAFVWVASLSYAVRALVAYSRMVTPDGRVVCNINPKKPELNKRLFLLDFTFVFGVPSLTLGVFYGALSYTLKSGDMTGSGKTNRVVRMLVYLYILFIVCYLPLNSFRLHVFVGDVSHIPPLTLTITNLSLSALSFTNSFLNPIFYAWFNPKIRGAFLSITRMDKVCCKPDNAVAPDTSRFSSVPGTGSTA